MAITESRRIQTNPATRKRATAVYTAQEVADMVGVHLNRVYIEAAAGNIPCLRYGRRFIFPRAAIDRYLADAGIHDAA